MLVVRAANNWNLTVSRARHIKSGALPFVFVVEPPQLASGTHLLLGEQAEFPSYSPSETRTNNLLGHSPVLYHLGHGLHKARTWNK